MPKLLDEWTVQDHGPLSEVDDGLLTATGSIEMPLGYFPRRMTAVGLSRKRVAIWSPVALPDAAMERIEALGQIAFLIVPNPHHRLDLRAFAKRYPEAKVVTPPGAKATVGEAAPVDATDDVLADPNVDVLTVDGTNERESALLVRRGDTASLLVNDVIAHVAHPKGVGAKIMARLFGFGVHAPQVPRAVKRAFVEDPKALARQFRSWAKTPGLKRIIPSHGDIIRDDPAGVLRRLADRLD